MLNCKDFYRTETIRSMDWAKRSKWSAKQIIGPWCVVGFGSDTWLPLGIWLGCFPLPLLLLERQSFCSGSTGCSHSKAIQFVLRWLIMALVASTSLVENGGMCCGSKIVGKMISMHNPNTLPSFAFMLTDWYSFKTSCVDTPDPFRLAQIYSL